MENNINFRHSFPIQIRFNDVDMFGHVNNAVYFSFYDLGKTAYFTTVCPNVDWLKMGIVVVHIEADFLAQIFGEDEVVVQTAISSLGTKSLKLSQQVVDVHTKEVKCQCTSVMVVFDLEKHCSVPIPDDWKASIMAYEKENLSC